MVPQIWGTIAVVWTTITIVVLKVFDIVFAMTNGQWNTQVLANFMYDWMFRGFDFGRGAAIAIIIMILVTPIMVWNIRRANAEAEGADHGHRSPARRPALVWALHISVILLVAIWTLPTAGLLISSLRDKDQIAVSGWWTSLRPAARTWSDAPPLRISRSRSDGKFVIAGNILQGGKARSPRFGHLARKRRRLRAPATVADLGDGRNPDGRSRWRLRDHVAQRSMEDGRGQRIFYHRRAIAALHHRQLQRRAVARKASGRAFLNSLTVTIPATIIPIMVAAFAAYALAWMRFPGRALLIAGSRRPAGRAAADVADPAADAVQRDRRLVRHFGQGICRHLAGAYGLRPAAGDLPAAQLHGRPAARDHRIRRASTAPSDFEIFMQDRPAAVVPGAGLVRHLPVPVGMERSAGRAWFSSARAGGPARADRQDRRACSVRAAATGRS